MTLGTSSVTTAEKTTPPVKCANVLFISPSTVSPKAKDFPNIPARINISGGTQIRNRGVLSKSWNEGISLISFLIAPPAPSLEREVLLLDVSGNTRSFAVAKPLAMDEPREMRLVA